MYKYNIGETVRIREIEEGADFISGRPDAGSTFTIGDDDRRMSLGIRSIPLYYYRGSWYTESELEEVEPEPPVIP